MVESSEHSLSTTIEETRLVTYEIHGAKGAFTAHSITRRADWSAPSVLYRPYTTCCRGSASVANRGRFATTSPSYR
jgi:hypothetical protein